MDDDYKESRNKIIIISIIAGLALILIIVFVVWLIGKVSNRNVENTQTTPTVPAATESSSTGVKELVTYTLPNNWLEATCNEYSGVIYFVPEGDTLDCNEDPQSAITLSIDPQNRTNCNQLQNVENVSKHVCKSIFIDNYETLEAQTVYSQDSSVLPNRTLDAYYMDTGSGVVTARYIHNGSAPHGTGFHDLVFSLNVK